MTTSLARCACCGNSGAKGPQWILTWGNETSKVHKPCGERLVANAPPGIVVRLRPSNELRDEWNRKRDERDVRSFWESAFAKAKEKANGKNSP